ncbi:MAG TPA: hypothetical protein VGH56_00760, partial [Solirubrobacteraceae bacterium]
AELAALVEAERACCSFVAWALGHEGIDSVLTVTADPYRPDDVASIAALFSAISPSATQGRDRSSRAL